MLGWFRRHATVLMVVLGSAAMVIFGLGSVFESFTRSATQKTYENPTFAQWAGGEFTRDSVNRVYRNHAESQRFLGAVIEAAEKKAGDRINVLAPLIQPIRESNDEMGTAEQIMDRLMLAEEAKREGMLISGDTVNAYIGLVSGGAEFSNAELQQINRSVNSTSLAVVKEHLKTELMAMQMDRMSMVGLSLTTPNVTEAISLYGRTAEKIDCEVVPFSVADYVGKVDGEPSKNEISELYNEGRGEYPDPSGEKPGFKIGSKINVQYLVADYDTFLQNEVNKISDEEVQAEYDRLVEKKDILVMEPIVQDNDFFSPDLSDPAPKPGDEKEDSESADDESAGEDDAPAAPADVEAPPADEAEAKKDDGDSPTTDIPKLEEPAALEAPTTESSDVPAVEAAPKTEAPKLEAPKAEDGQSLTVRKSMFQFVSTRLQEDKKAEEAEAKADEAKTDEAKIEAAVETKADEDMPEPPADDEGQEPDAGSIGDDIEAELKKKDEAPVRKFKPLADVADDIRRSLAQPRAQVAMAEAIERTEEELQDYYSILQDWEDEGEKGERPAAPDFDAMAKEYNLSFRETGLADEKEIKKDPFGGLKVGVYSIGDFLFVQSRTSKLFEPNRLGGNTNVLPDYYLYWMVEKTDPRMPTLDEVREDVQSFWKAKKAFELAEKAANELKDKVNDARDQKMTEMFPEKATPTGEFAWFDSRRGNVLSQPGNVDSPSDKFMSTAFSLNDMEAGVAPSGDRETLYVVQAISGRRPVNEVGLDYLQNQLMKYERVPIDVQRAASYYSGREQIKMDENRKEEFGFESQD
jgi:hypothetical protein